MALVIGCGVVYASNRDFYASLAGGKSGMVAGTDNKISVQALHVLFWLFAVAYPCVVAWCFIGRVDSKAEDKMVGI